MTDAKARLLQMIANEPHMGGGGLLKAVGKAQKMSKAAETGARAILPAVERDANLAKMMADSKVKDRLYHGTTEDIQRFDPSKSGTKTKNLTTALGTFLSNNPAEASRYAKDWGAQGGNVMPVFAQVTNPYQMPYNEFEGLAMGAWNRMMKDPSFDPNAVVKWNDIEGAKRAAAAVNKHEPDALQDVLNRRDELIAQGHDAVIVNIGGNKEVIVFDPTKIKSAIGNRGTYDLNDPDITKAGGGAVHMAGGGTHWSMGNPEQFAKNKSERLYPKLERMNPAVKAVKNQVDAFNRLVDQGVPIKDLVGGLVGAVPFVGPDMRKGMEGATVNLPAGFKKSATNPQVATGIEMAPAKVADILGELKPSDFTGTKGMSNVLGDVGRGYAPNVLDVLDTLGMDITGFGGVGLGTAIKGGRKAAGALSNLAKSETGYKLAQKVINSPYMAPMSMYVVKPEGGNWLSGNTEKGLKHLKRGNYDIPQNIRDDLHIEDLTPQELAINKWVDSNLTNYVKKQMATPGDPVRKLAEQGIVHIPSEQVGVNRYRAPKHREAYGGQQLGESEAAKAWEDASDVAINAPKAKTIKENESLYQANPWVGKLSNEERVFTLGNPAPHSVGMAANLQPIHGLGFDHIVDVLNQDIAAGRIRPEQLNKVSMEQAVRRTYEYDQEMAKKMRETQAKVTEGMPVHKEYPEGYKWIELALPETPTGLPEGWTLAPNSATEKTGLIRAMSPDGVTVLGKDMPDLVKNVYRRHPDSPGNPKQQLEQALKYEGDTMGHCVGGYCPDVLEGRSRIFSLRDAKGEPHVTIETRPKKMTAGQWFQNLPEEEKLATAKDITGKGYSGREEDYPPYQEWLKNAPENIIQIKGKQNRAPKEDYLPFVQDFVKSGKWSDVGDLRNTGLRKVEGQYMTEPEHDDWLLNQLQPPEPGMAEGGEVKSFFEEKSAKQRLLDMIAEEPHMGIGVRPSRLQLQGEIANDTYGGIGGGGRATYIHPIGSDAAIRAYMEGGGYKPKDMDYKGQVNNMGISYEKEFKDGGDAHMAGGGVLKAVAKAQKTAKQAKMYSAVDKALEASKRGAGTGMEFANELAKTSGIKKAELVDRGIMVPSKNGPVLNPALTQLPKMTKQEFVSHLNEKYKPPGVRKISITDPKLTDEVIHNKAVKMMADDVNDYVDRHGDADYDDVFNSRYNNDYDQYFERAKEALSEDVGTKYSQYKLPGGENYRENLYQYENPTGKAFLQSHFDEPNVMYHMRQTDRVTPKGKALHVEEIQSDWHQKGRKGGYANETAYQEVRQKADDVARAAGYQDAFHAAEGWKVHGMESAKEASDMLDEASKFKSVNSVPDAPFKNNWHEHAIKQALMDAAEGDYNQLLITPGAEQAKRFDLTKVADAISYHPDDKGRGMFLNVFGKNNQIIYSKLTPESELPNVIGQETAQKLLAQAPDDGNRVLRGLELELGGEGMAGFYDKMVPNYLNDIGKKYGVRVGEHAIEGDVPYSKTTPTLADVQRLAQEMYGVSDIQAISALPLEQRNAINQAFADKVRAEHTTKLHSFDITPEMREDILSNGLPMYQRGGEVHMGKGGLPGGGIFGAIAKAQKVGKAARAAEEAAQVAKYLPGVHYADPLAPATMKMSEALGNAGAEGKTLKFTEADRSRVFGSNRGGVGFAGLQHYSEPHKEANTVWGFGNKLTAEKKVRQNDPENILWTTFVGAPDQHKSNSVVLQDAVQAFQDAVNRGDVHPAQIKLMNDRIKAAIDDKTKALLFDPSYDLTDPQALAAANSFARRAAIGDVLLGEGVKGPMRRKEFKEQYKNPTWHDSGNMESILQRETDPDLIGAGTFDIGNRLFALDNGIIHRPDLNAAFPYQVTGNDLGMKFELVPKEIAMPDWMRQYDLPRGKTKKVTPPSYMDLSRNNPSQFVSEDYLTGLQKQGKKKGGLAHTKKVKRHGNTVSN